MINNRGSIWKKSLKEKFQEKRQKAKDRHERFQLIISFIGALFFVYTTFVGTREAFADSPLYIYIIIFTVAYLAIFALFILIHLKNSKKLKEDTKNFKKISKLLN